MPNPSTVQVLSYIALISGFLGPATLVQAAEKDAKPGKVRLENVRFQHGKNVLAGTLYLPAGPGPHPALALVFGSGAQDRNYGGTGPALGRHFARHGYACLAWDKPGVGQSTGDFYAQTLRDRAEEALAAVRFLRSRSDIAPARVGLWGHSQGGMVVPLAASLSDHVAFVIEVSGWQGPAWRQDQTRVEAEMRADRFSEPEIKTAVAFAKTRMDLIRSAKPFAEMEKIQQPLKGLPWFDKHVHACDEALFYSARRNVELDTEPWWEGVHCPVLVIFGDRDTSSGPPEPLIPIIRRGLAKAGNQNVRVKIFAGADHSLRKAKIREAKEVRQRDGKRPREAAPQFVDGYLDTMTTWLKNCAPR
jgi:pimeloyl-ACP methyl ester carboxylesterase